MQFQFNEHPVCNMDIFFFFNIALFSKILGSKLAAAHHPPHFFDRNLVEPACFA